MDKEQVQWDATQWLFANLTAIVFVCMMRMKYLLFFPNNH